MSRYKSEQTAYNPLKKKYVPLWRLDTNTMTITHFNPDTLTVESKTYSTDFIRYDGQDKLDQPLGKMLSDILDYELKIKQTDDKST